MHCAYLELLTINVSEFLPLLHTHTHTRSTEIKRVTNTHTHTHSLPSHKQGSSFKVCSHGQLQPVLNQKRILQGMYCLSNNIVRCVNPGLMLWFKKLCGNQLGRSANMKSVTGVSNYSTAALMAHVILGLLVIPLWLGLNGC